jgi:hypothetical protein
LAVKLIAPVFWLKQTVSKRAKRRLFVTLHLTGNSGQRISGCGNLLAIRSPFFGEPGFYSHIDRVVSINECKAHSLA